MSDEKQLPPCDAEVFEKGESIGLFPGIKKEDVERLCKGLSAVTGWRIDWSYFAGRPHIRALAPAEQHQGEPVELPARMKTIVRSDYAIGWNDCIALIETLGPLYKHADPVDVEHIEHQLSSAVCKLGSMERLAAKRHEEREDLRDQLAERDALLDRVVDHAKFWHDHPYAEVVEGIARDYKALSASAEPGVSAEHCESEEIGQVVYAGPDRKTVTIRCKSCGHYAIEHGHVIERRLQCCECGSKAFFILLPSEKPNPENKASTPDCATCNDEGAVGNILDTVPCPDCAAAPPAGIDDLTDLATWKRRAIEAESKLRTYDPQVVELGEQAMQALLANPKPSELVLTKCRLCDQLQGDLTQRDERIDFLEQQVQLADHWLEFASFNNVGEPVEHTQEMRDEFRKQMIAAVFPDLESRPEERGTPEAEPCSGCGTPGWTGACNKCVPY